MQGRCGIMASALDPDFLHFNEIVAGDGGEEETKGSARSVFCGWAVTGPGRGGGSHVPSSPPRVMILHPS